MYIVYKNKLYPLHSLKKKIKYYWCVVAELQEKSNT